MAVFSLGDARRRMIGPSSSLPEDYFWAEGRSEATEKLRLSVKRGLEEDVQTFFTERKGQVAIYDANVSEPPLALAVLRLRRPADAV